jgi:hypothetical protein
MDGGPMSGLAAALQAAKLKKTQPKENSGGSTTSSNSSGYGTIGRQQGMAVATSGGGGGMPSMMDEMQKTLARRRAKVDRQVEVSGFVCVCIGVCLYLSMFIQKMVGQLVMT